MARNVDAFIAKLLRFVAPSRMTALAGTSGAYRGTSVERLFTRMVEPIGTEMALLDQSRFSC